jgi:NADPH:quinone reductase-like Zn-dependent oxidoreductase
LRLAFGLTRPRQPILGTELSGVIERVGARVTRLRPGDAVIAMTGAGMGCHAELKTLPETSAIVLKPASLSFEEAACIAFGGTTALYFLRDRARVTRGERVLINGASGCVGTAAVQIARHLGAIVTGVCSAANADLVRGLGAEETIDYRAADFAARERSWDVIVDTVGNAPFAHCRPALADRGRLLLLAAGLGELIRAPFQSMVGRHRVLGGVAPERAADLAYLTELCETGAFQPVVDSRYPLARIAEAHARVDTGHKVGSVVVTMPASNPLTP